MEILDRTMTPMFDAFYTDVERELSGLDITYQAMERGKRVGGRELGERVWGLNVSFAGSRSIAVLLSGELADEPYSHNAAHELAHIYCGHLGGHDKGQWPDRRMLLAGSQMELEAEAAAYIVCSRAEITTRSADFLAGLVAEQDLQSISYFSILTAANRIEARGSRSKVTI